jgi:hypothetical protein
VVVAYGESVQALAFFIFFGVLAFAVASLGRPLTTGKQTAPPAFGRKQSGGTPSEENGGIARIPYGEETGFTGKAFPAAAATTEALTWASPTTRPKVVTSRNARSARVRSYFSAAVPNGTIFVRSRRRN